jgi:SAM-dependent methyltransferase
MGKLRIDKKFVARNHPAIAKLGQEKTGAVLVALMCERLGIKDLSNLHVLDVGCGYRFTQTIINRNIPIGTYTGIEVYGQVVDYLKKNVKDSRFTFHHWDVHNALYNPTGHVVARESNLPLPDARRFDVICLFSVFTHLNPEDSQNLLHILRRYVAHSGRLFFSAFIDNGIDSFEDRVKEEPMLQAYYTEGFMRQMISDAGWRVDSFHTALPEKHIQSHFVCSPIQRS